MMKNKKALVFSETMGLEQFNNQDNSNPRRISRQYLEPVWKFREGQRK